eukprot:TRINITY_DN6779_c0_g1_i1.p1 TRINITY_DN6779_c0_g1~~TRINITY_DN6779_c0_g1_i1.p1  ORF type:complete len:167 (-),score=51.47 TRINITY_DN6779_c0_g1_i1:224-724(-)
MARLSTLFLLFANAFLLGLLMVDSVMDERSFQPGVDTLPAVMYYQTLTSSGIMRVGVPIMVVLAAAAWFVDIYNAKSKIEPLFTALVLVISAGLFGGIVLPTTQEIVRSGLEDIFQLQTLAYVHLLMMVLGVLNVYILFSRLIRKEHCERCTCGKGPGRGAKRKAK